MSVDGGGGDAQGGIRVKRETIIIMSDREDSPEGLDVGTPSVTIRADSADVGTSTQAQQYRRPKAFRKLSNASSIISEIFRHPEASEDRLRNKIKRANERDSSRALIEFLKNTSPPPPRPLPPDAESPKRKRHLFWPFLRRRMSIRNGNGNNSARRGSSSPSTPLIQLPESTVAGQTTGGHRHIAINIPAEHASSTAPDEPASLPSLEHGIAAMPLEPVAEKQESEDGRSPASGFHLQLIPPLSDEAFSSLLSPHDSLSSTSTSSTSSSGTSTPADRDLASSDAGYTSVRLENMVVPPSPTLTAPAKGSVSNLVSLKGGSHLPKLRHPRCQLPVRGRHSIAGSAVINRTETVISDATTATGFGEADHGAVKSLASSSSCTDADAVASICPSGSRLGTPLSEGSHDRTPSDLMRRPHRYHPREYSPGHGSRFSLSPIRREYMYDSLALDAFLSQPGMACPLCLTPIMLVANYRATLSRGSTPELERPGSFVTACESVVSRNSFSHFSSSVDALSSRSSRLEEYSTASVFHRGRSPHPYGLGSNTAELFPRQARAGGGRRVLRSTKRPIVPSSAFSARQRHCRSRPCGCSSHRDLIYCEEPASQSQREGELGMLLDRLEMLESKNDRCLQAVVPVLEYLTRSLLNVTHQIQQHSHGSGSASLQSVLEEDNDGEIWFQQQRQRGRRTSRTPEPSSSLSPDERTDCEGDHGSSFRGLRRQSVPIPASGYTSGLAVDRLPSRHGFGENKPDGDYKFGYSPPRPIPLLDSGSGSSSSKAVMDTVASMGVGVANSHRRYDDYRPRDRGPSFRERYFSRSHGPSRGLRIGTGSKEYLLSMSAGETDTDEHEHEHEQDSIDSDFSGLNVVEPVMRELLSFGESRWGGGHMDGDIDGAQAGAGAITGPLIAGSRARDEGNTELKSEDEIF